MAIIEEECIACMKKEEFDSGMCKKCYEDAIKHFNDNSQTS